MKRVTVSTLAIQLILIVNFLGTAEALGSASSGTLWAVTGIGKCNATCGNEPTTMPVPRSGWGTLQFGCYATSSTAVKPLPRTSPPMWAAKSTVMEEVEAGGRLTDDRCSGTPKPPILTVECQSSPSTCADASAGTELSDSGYKWRWNLDGEIACNARCNHIGSLSVPIDCVNSAGTVTKVHFCRHLARPELSLPCYQFDGCHPVWKAEPWGVCSRKCGLGEIERKVECYQLVDSPTGPSYQLKRGRCSHSEDKPHLREYCVVNRTCQPYYRITPGKCRLHFSAGGPDHRLCNETGLIRNSPRCAQLTADLRARTNVTAQVDQSLCRALGLVKPPPFGKCRVDAETLRQRGVKCTNPSASREPRFSPVTTVLVQMERRESLRVECGQSATIIPGTRVRLHCKVANFKAIDLRWLRPRGDGVVETLGAPLGGCKRVCAVDGDLVIAKFRPRDSGLYVVTAGSQNATLSLHSHSAYQAYIHAYLPRMMLLHPRSHTDGRNPHRTTKQLQLDTPNRDTLLWMPGPWSACSVPCGGRGHRSRSVHCEQLRSSAYVIVGDGVCEAAQLGGERPAREEACGSHTCPVWRTGEWDEECSVRHCYSPGYSLLTRRVQCVNEADKTLLEAQCAHEKKPETVHRCRNAICQPTWHTGLWSPCSVSCGAYGFSSRQIRCVWQSNGFPAGIACETAALEPPKSFKACYTGACERLGCLDLSPVCSIYQASALCAHPSLRRNCCKTCNVYQLHVYHSLATNGTAA